MRRNSITPRWHSFTRSEFVRTPIPSDILSTGNLRSRHPVDHGFSVSVQLRFTIGAESWKSHFDQTHSAIARRAELLVITVSRHITAGLFARLDHTRAFRELMPHAIDLDVEHRR